MIDLSLSSAEESLREALRAFVRREAGHAAAVDLYTSSGVTWSDSWRTALTQGGFLSLLVPAKAGGQDATAVESVVVCQEFGRVPVAGPAFETSFLGPSLLRACSGSPDLLRSIARGEALISCCLGQGDDVWSSGAVWKDGAVTGQFPLVPYADLATHLVVLVGSPGADLSLCVVPTEQPGVTIQRLPGFISGRARVALDNAEAGPKLRFTDSSPAALAKVLAAPSLALCGYMLGAIQRMLEMSVEYTNTRIQFGVPIGKFQRVQDHTVRLVNDYESARLTTYQAAAALDESGDFTVPVHLANAITADAFYDAADAAHEVHAGIGSDPDFGLTMFTELSRTLLGYLGTPQWHRRQMTDALVAASVAA